jgi:TM2 domain-containing membrane protein YozV
MNQEINYSEKSYWTFLACFSLFILGAHQFYLGNIKAGFIRLGCSITLIGLPITLILVIKDTIQLYRGTLCDSKGLPIMSPGQVAHDMSKASIEDLKEKKDDLINAKDDLKEIWKEGKDEVKNALNEAKDEVKK